MQKQIFITMDGGLIQDINVSADLEDVKVTVVDFDVEGTRLDIHHLPHGDAIIFLIPTDIINDAASLKFWEEILTERNK